MASGRAAKSSAGRLIFRRSDSHFRTDRGVRADWSIQGERAEFSSGARGGLFFQFGDEDLSLGSLVGKDHLKVCLGMCSSF